MVNYNHLPNLLEHPILLAFLTAANWPVYRYLVGVLFGGREGFGEAIRYWFIPDLYSYLTNRYVEDIWAELRLGALFAMCAGCVIIEYLAVTSFLDWWYANVVCCDPSKM